MRLNLFKWLEDEVVLGGRRYDGTKRPRFASVGPAKMLPEEAELDRIQAKETVDYRLRFGARARADLGQLTQSKQRVFEMLSRELFKDLIEELHQLEEWAFLEGYDKAMTDRLRRLTKLCYGEDVQDVS